MAEIPSTSPVAGHAGLQTQVPGAPATVSAAANATGGIGAGNLIERDIDAELAKFKSDDTPLMQLMLLAKKVRVKSPEVDHYMIDEPRSSIVTSANLAGGTMAQAVLPLDPADAKIVREYGTLLVKGVDGYGPDGKTPTPGRPLMLFVAGRDAATGNPIVTAANGKKSSADAEESLIPYIPAGSRCIILANALYETQKVVDPDLIVPQPTTVYLQKRGMNQVVSDYFDAQRKRIPFGKALIAEAAITKFKVDGNRTLYSSRMSKFQRNVPKMGMQNIYTTEGVRWQVRRELCHSGRWTFERLIALTKMIFTGEDVPKRVVCLGGKDFMEQIQCIDFSRHPEVKISVDVNKLGWSVTNFHSFFGDIEFKHDPTLDRLGWSHSALVVAPDRVVHYQYSAEHKASDRIEGEEATRESILVWDALALKGASHLWIDGDGEGAASGQQLVLWEGDEAPAGQPGTIYYLIDDCPGIADSAKSGTMWTFDGDDWQEYSGPLSAG